jgi:hypothetical protein
MQASVREPAVAGRFYPSDLGRLRAEVENCLGEVRDTGPALALVAPHAGYMYSGRVAGIAFGSAGIPGRVIVVGPNHTGLGSVRSVWQRGVWRSPLGDVPVDEELAVALSERAGLDADEAAHTREHSLEVEVPFLQVRRPDVGIVPVCLGPLSAKECLELGEAIADVVRAASGPVLLVASTDMSHYVSAGEAKRLDRLALDRLEALDADGLYSVVRTNRISMCGVVPTTVVLAAARALGALRAEVLAYANSGDVSGDYARVVGYAAARVG